MIDLYHITPQLSLVAHTLIAKIVHWTFIPLYVYGIFKQVGDISDLEDSDLLLTETIFASSISCLSFSRDFFT